VRSMLSATTLGAEYQVNTAVTNDQRSVVVGSNPNSTQIVIAWVSASEDGSGEGVYAQRYDLNGAKVGAAFRANATTNLNQGAPAIAMDSLGGFVIAWQNNSTTAGDGSGYGIYARRFGYDGTPLTTTDFRVNTATSGDQLAPAVAMDDTGNFAIAFQSSSGDGSGTGVYARLYDSTGAARTTAPFLVNQFTTGNQQAPSIAISAAGVVIAWQSAAQDASSDAVVARRYGPTGSSLGNEFIVNQTTAGNQNNPSVAANADGSFVIAWQSALQDTSGSAIVARQYDSAGAAIGNEFLANQFSTGDQTNPSITSAGDSGFVIAWQSALQDGNSDAVVARQFTAAGAPTGNEFIANTFTTGAQNNPSIGMESDGDFLLAWQSPGQETTGGTTTLGVFARRYSAVNDAPVMRQITNQITDVGGTIAFTAKADDADSAIDTLTYSLAPGSPAGATINSTTGAFTWNTTGVTPDRYFITIIAQDLAGATDETTVATTVFAPGQRTALDDYVNAVDPTASWTIRNRVIGDGFIRYDVLLVSGSWRSAAEVDKPLWQHWMAVYVPNVVTNNKALLFIDGGSFTTTPTVNADIDAYAGPLAASAGSVFIDLMAVPSQPLKFAGESSSRTEDQIIAYSWAKYLQTGDSTWILNLPMTRAAMRAMDTAISFLNSPLGGNIDLESFVVTGGSKRGWTTWLASAADPRVSAEIPIVADLLNTEESFAHHYAFYNGAFAAAVNDYVAAGVLNVNNFGLDRMDELTHIVDPYSYLDRLTLPKLILNASGDEFFVPDSWKYYYDQLPGPKAIRYFPNSGHGSQSIDQIADSLLAMTMMLADQPLPEYDFHQLADGTIEVITNETVVNATLWKATNASKRDFRNAYVGDIFTSSTLNDLGGGVYRGNVPTPAAGYTAYYIELTIATPMGDMKVSTGVYLKGNPPTNNPPELQPIDDLVIPEGSPLSLQALASDPDVGQTLKYYLETKPAQLAINLNTGAISGVWTDQSSGALPVTVAVWDNGTPLLPDRSQFTITVVNVAPTATLNGSTSGALNQPLSFTLLASDPSSVDQAAGFTFHIDWNGDGSDVQTVQGASGTVVQHTFTTSGAKTVHLTATDKDGGVSQASTLTVNLNRPPVDPLNQLPLTINEGSSLFLQATGWTDPDNDPLTYAWDLDADGQYDDAAGDTATLTWSNLVAIGIVDNGAYLLRLRVDDGLGGVTYSAPIPLSIANAAPTADAGGPYTINEGGSLSLLGFGVDPAGLADPLTYSWDVNGDGVFGDATGAAPTLTWTHLISLGIYDGPNSFNVQLRVNDGDGGVTDSAITSLTVNNAAPTLGVSGPTSALRGTSVIMTLTATDPSLIDAQALFTFTVNWGDGSPLLVLTGGSGLQPAHAYNVAGSFVVSVTATDADGGISASATQGVQVDAIRLRANADNPLLTDLVWSGTSAADTVKFEQVDPTTIRVREQVLNGVAVNNEQVFSGVTGRLIAYGNAGNDTLDAAGLATKVTLDGGANNNTLYGGNGGDILIGGSNGGEGRQGNNVIIAGNGNNTIYGNDVLARKSASGGNNLIVGGSGNDIIYGNFGANLVTSSNPAGNGGEGGQNVIVAGGGADTVYASQIVDGVEGGHGSVLIGGSTSLNEAALLSVLSEWTSVHTYEQKIANITGVGTADRLNGNNYLQTGQTVFDDGAIDDIFSDTNGKANWLLYRFSQDTTHRVKPGETLTDTL